MSSQSQTYSAGPEQPAPHDPNRSRWIPYAFVGFFLVMLVANGIMVFFALGTFNGLSTDQPYDRGLSYNQTLADYQAQRALGWYLDVAFTEETALAGTLAVTVTDNNGAPLTGAEIAATFMRPINEGTDRVVDLYENMGGHYTAHADLALPGQWLIRIEVSHPDGHYRLEHRIELK